MDRTFGHRANSKRVGTLHSEASIFGACIAEIERDRCWGLPSCFESPVSCTRWRTRAQHIRHATQGPHGNRSVKCRRVHDTRSKLHVLHFLCDKNDFRHMVGRVQTPLGGFVNAGNKHRGPKKLESGAPAPAANFVWAQNVWKQLFLGRVVLMPWI